LRTRGGEEEEEWGTGVAVRAYRTNLPAPTWEAVLDDGSRTVGSMMAYGGDRLFVVRQHWIWALDPNTGETL
jgi:hypothetical protein